jgi:hypothetical protein
MIQPSGRLISSTLIVVIAVAMLVGCVSRYRMELLLITDGESEQLKIEESNLVLRSVIDDPYADVKLRAGSEHTLMVVTSMRGKPLYTRPEMVFALDEYFRSCLYVNLPKQPVAGTIRLASQSFVQVLGQWEIPTEEKIFLPVGGELVIDSVVSEKLFATINGHFESRSGKSLEYRGQFKASLKGLPSEDQD